MLSIWLRIVGVLALTACAGRPSFSNPECAKDYDNCADACEAKCPREQHRGPYEPDPNHDLDELQIECADCVNQCVSEASKCERKLTECRCPTRFSKESLHSSMETPEAPQLKSYNEC